MQCLVGSTFALIVTSAASAQTTWYVDAAAPPPGNGTLASPYASIQFAHDQPATVDLDTLSVAPGVYVGNLTISKVVRIVAAAGPEVTVLRAAAPGNLVLATAVDGLQLATLRGFTLDGSAHTSGTGITVDNSNAAVLRVERCVVHGFASGTAIAVGSAGYVEALQITVARNAVGVRVLPAISNGVATLRASILRENTLELWGITDGYDPQHSNVAPELVGLGSANISSDPGFWYSAVSDFHLRAGSPCIDALPLWIAPLDPDGSAGDMGALAFEAEHGWSSYCTSGTTSNGCAPTMSAAGVPAASATSGFTITVSGVEGAKDGHIFYGTNGPHAAPWGASSHDLCVKAPSQRTGTQNSGAVAGTCDGVIAIDWCAYVAAHPSALGAPFDPGDQVWAQLYFRDPPGPKTTALSNALTFSVVP